MTEVPPQLELLLPLKAEREQKEGVEKMNLINQGLTVCSDSLCWVARSLPRRTRNRKVATMQQDGVEKTISEEGRKEIFSALVEAQDQQMTVEQSRKEVAERFGLSEGQLRKIEQEGLDNEWPSL